MLSLVIAGRIKRPISFVVPVEEMLAISEEVNDKSHGTVLALVFLCADWVNSLAFKTD